MKKKCVSGKKLKKQNKLKDNAREGILGKGCHNDLTTIDFVVYEQGIVTYCKQMFQDVKNC